MHRNGKLFSFSEGALCERFSFSLGKLATFASLQQFRALELSLSEDQTPHIRFLTERRKFAHLKVAAASIPMALLKFFLASTPDILYVFFQQSYTIDDKKTQKNMCCIGVVKIFFRTLSWDR